MSVLSRDAGTSRLAWRAACALRMRVSMSAIGSDVVIPGLPPRSLPAALHHAGDLSRERQVAEANAAQLEFADEAARAPATQAAVAVPARELGRLSQLGHGQPLVS